MTMILIPAAGASTRMRGTDKLLRDLGGEPLLLRSIRIARATGHPVVVTVPSAVPQRAAAIAGLADEGVQVQEIGDPSEGLSVSLRAGAARAAGCGRDLLVHLPDMPALTTGDLRKVLAAKQPGDRIVRATTEDGLPGHPVLFDLDILPEFEGLSGDAGAAVLLDDNPVRLVRLEGGRARLDLDTPEAWDAFDPTK